VFDIVFVFSLVVAITLLTLVAERARIPYPIILVLGGLVVSLVPGIPVFTISPDYVFFFFLPPILYGAAWFTSWRDFKFNLRPIMLLAVGAVLFTMLAVAWVAHALIPGMSWPVAFVLGAVVSPPDAVAATAVLQRLGVQRRIVTILEGESLVNDASGIVAYKFALAAVFSGSFSLGEASLQFVLVAAGGMAIGLLIGAGIVALHKQFNAPIIETLITFLTPYAAYLIAETFHASGVLAVVCCGLYVAWRSPMLFTPLTRIVAESTWQTVIFLLNGLIFILIGLQVRQVTRGMTEFTIGQMLGWGAAVSAATIMARMIWIYPATYLPRFLIPSERKRDPYPHLKYPTIIGWTGMRGVVSLAAALALPLTLNSGAPFPHRDTILFVTFCVILSTLVLQGLSLPWVIRMLHIPRDMLTPREENDARHAAAYAALAHLRAKHSATPIQEQLFQQVNNRYRLRVSHYTAGKDGVIDAAVDAEYFELHRLELELIHVQRREVIRLRDERRIGDEAMHAVERELDLEEERLNYLLRQEAEEVGEVPK